MLVTIITVSYNSASTINATLRSVASQSYPFLEHIIVDNNSIDETLLIVKEFPHVKKAISEPDNGIYDAMNKGVKMASGEIISILNSDDIYENDKVIEEVVNTFKSSEALIVYGNLYYVSKTNTKKVIRNWKSSSYKPNAFLYGWHPPHPTVFVKKIVYERYGLFDTSLNLSADFELMLRFIEKYKVRTVFLNKVLIRMRTGGASKPTLKSIISVIKDVRRAFKKNELSYKLYYPVTRFLPKLLQFIRNK